MNIRQIFLLVTAIGLIPIALSYGLLPQKSLSYLFDVSISNINGSHIFRALMSLYLALLTFWIVGAFKVQLRQAALYSLIVFIFGLSEINFWSNRYDASGVDGFVALVIVLFNMFEVNGVSNLRDLSKLKNVIP
jgi:hypothetical protein